MKRLCIICEGLTEAEFVKTVIAPHLFENSQVIAYPALLNTKKSMSGGGNVSIERIARHIQHEYRNTDFITTLVDYYGFKRKGGDTKFQLEKKVLDATATLIDRFDSRRVIPYIQMHEFEALLFSDVSEFRWVLDGWNEAASQKLSKIVSSFNSPEEINDSPETAPSKRILRIFDRGQYSKKEHGPIIAENIGLSAIRRQCPNFHAWISRLEELAEIKGV